MMVLFKLEGGVSLSDKQISVISKVFREKGFQNEIINSEAVGKAICHYGSNVDRFFTQKDEQTFKLVAKTATTAPVIRSTSFSDKVFNNESFMYKEVLSKFRLIEKQAKVPENQRIRFAACYDTLLEEFHEIILLEDLRESGYITLNILDSFTDETVKIVLTCLARLHSLSHALKNREPVTFDAIKNKMVGLDLVIDSKEWNNLLQKYVNQIGDLFQTHKHGFNIQKAVSEVIINIEKNSKFSRDSEYCVIIQGDICLNNLMFQFKDGKPNACCMIDYQLSNCNSPVMDILLMIFRCTDLETRSRHYHDWINFYHLELDRFLKFYGLAVNEVYPKERLDEDLKLHGILAVGMATVTYIMSSKDSYEVKQIKNAMRDGKGQNVFLNFTQTKESARMDIFTSQVIGLMKTAEEIGIF